MLKLIKHILRDLTKDRHRAVLSMLAMIIGMASFGIVLFCQTIITREIPQAYSQMNPASASLLVDNIDDKFIDIVNSFENIEAYEVSGYYNYRVKVNNDWKTLELFASDNYPNRNYNKPKLLGGTLELGVNEALIERDAISIAKADIGDTVSIMLGDTNTVKLKIIGSVNDLSVHPATMHNVVYLYVDFATLKEWEVIPNKIEYVVTGNQFEKDNILQISDEFIAMLESNGYAVKNLQVENTPGKSMHMAEYEGALFLLQIFSIISLIFGGMIMSNLISSILAKQVRQIGVIKAIGGSFKKILFSYMACILCVVVSALVISSLLVIFISGKLSVFLLSIGNMIPESTIVPWYILVLYIISSFLVPMVISSFPIIRGLRVTVKEAFNDYGISSLGTSRTKLQIHFLSRPVVLSLRNAWRKKGRFILNSAILTFAGAMFIAVISNMMSVQNAIDRNIGMLDYDYHVTISGKVDEKKVDEIVGELEEISLYEIWLNSTVQHVYENDQTGNAYSLISPQDESKIITPEIIEGRWIDKADTNQIVVTEKFLQNNKTYEVGGIIKLKIGSTDYEFEIAGIMNDFNMAQIYMSRGLFNSIVNTDITLKSVKMVTEGRRNSRSFYPNIDKVFEENNIYIFQSESIAQTKSTLAGHYSVTLQTFLIIIILIIFIAGFGLSATMNAQASERKREIGVMKAIGASEKQIVRVMTVESIFISLSSCIGAIMIGLGITMISVPVFGEIINVPLTIDIVSIIISFLGWVLLSFFVGYIASSKVAKRTAKMLTKEIFTIE